MRGLGVWPGGRDMRGLGVGTQLLLFEFFVVTSDDVKIDYRWICKVFRWLNMSVWYVPVEEIHGEICCGEAWRIIEALQTASAFKPSFYM